MGTAVYGLANSGTGVNYGVTGGTNSINGVGVLGITSAVNGNTIGVLGQIFSTSGFAVFGEASANTGVTGGVYGRSNSPDGYGVYGVQTGGNHAGYFEGRVEISHNLHVGGSLSKSSGSFKIDHPLDPENKYLYHSFVESPDMMNVYNGNVTLDSRGEAWVELPQWFDALNKNFRYQLTCIGGFAPVFIAEKVGHNRFKIGGGTPNLEVSWQVTGIRKDAYAEKNRIPVEEEKTGKERGRYLHPEAFGLSKDRGITWLHQPKPPQVVEEREEQNGEINKK
ncbi:MAG TPA: hypothetical protein VGB89_01150 [Bacteroidota bacterium]